MPQVNLHYESDEWLMVSTEAGRRGLVPARFVRILHSRSPFSSDPFGSGGGADPFSGSDPFASGVFTLKGPCRLSSPGRCRCYASVPDRLARFAEKGDGHLLPAH